MSLTIISEKMYKSKLAQWRKEGKLPPKRISGRSQKAMIRISDARLQQTGRGTTFRYRGHPVAPEKFEGYGQSGQQSSLLDRID